MFSKYPPLVRYILAIGMSFVVTMLLFLFYFIYVRLQSNIAIAELFSRIANPSNPENIGLLRSFLFIQTFSLFGIFPITFLWILTGDPFSFLRIKMSLFPVNILIVGILCMLLAIPFINLLAELNKMFIEHFWGYNNSMQIAEMAAEKVTKALLSDQTVVGLMLNIVVVALLPALCEEIFFRGTLLQILNKYFNNIHSAIIVSSLIFSLFHWQFYGFLPRTIIGIYFGYLFVYSGSLWLPIIVHFINNSAAIIVYFFINRGLISSGIETYGAKNNEIFIALLCGIVVISILIFVFVRMRPQQCFSKNQ